VDEDENDLHIKSSDAMDCGKRSEMMRVNSSDRSRDKDAENSIRLVRFWKLSDMEGRCEGGYERFVVKPRDAVDHGKRRKMMRVICSDRYVESSTVAIGHFGDDNPEQ